MHVEGRVQRFVFFVALLAGLVAAPRGQAATFEAATDGGVCTLRMAGAVQNGDLERLKAVFPAAGAPVHLCLNSSGGSFFEALRLAEFVINAGRPVRTIVDRGGECYSACSLIFMAGRSANGKPARTLHVLGMLGFHAPFIRPGQADYDASVVQRAHRESLRALVRFLQIIDPESFPDALLVQMLKTKPDDFLTVNTIADAGRFSVDLFGYRRPAQVSRAMLMRGCVNAFEDFDLNHARKPLSAAPVALKGGKFRMAIPDFGDEAAAFCIADVYSDGANLIHIDLTMASDAKGTDAPKPAALEAAVKASNDRFAVHGRPVWYLYEPNLKLKDIAER